MKNKSYGIYCISVLLLVIAASVYPIIMGARILADWLPDGIVAAADYPKYVIPYTPLSLALIAGTALLPLFLRYLKKWATPAASALSLGIFFAAEHFLEGLTVEADISGLIMVPNVTENVDLGNWQMYMCAITPPRVSYEIGIEPIDFSKTQVGILAGEYSPAFKLHFYLISTVLIIAITGCIYGFGQMLKSGDRSRRTALILQASSAAVFLGLCIFACFTAFFRTGNIRVGMAHVHILYTSRHDVRNISRLVPAAPAARTFGFASRRACRRYDSCYVHR